MHLAPIDLSAVRKHVGENHSHNRAKVFWKFGTSVVDDVDKSLLGVGAAGRPKARGLDSGYDGDALEIVRVCTTGHKNACSMIYGALCRAGFALGYDPIYTYTLVSECASCVRAAGFVKDAELEARPGWDTPSRPRVNVNLFGEEETPREAKIRWIRRG